MQILDNVLLKDYCTMNLGGRARYFVEVSKKEDVPKAIEFAREKHLRHFVLGGGANIVFLDDGYDGLVIKNSILGFEEINKSEANSTFRIGAGENWDKVVKQTCDMGLSGIEALSGIPGTVGGAPVQNIGAYGQELAETFVELQAYDTKESRFKTLKKQDCDFGYRTSIFKSSEIGRYIIVSITLKLTRTNMKPPFYASLQRYLEEHKITEYNPVNIRNSVIEIRKSKLPDPSVIANSGSFFQNPIVDQSQARQLSAQFSEMPQYPAKDGNIKIPAGWLIENVGLKGLHSEHFATYDLHALVITHDGEGSSSELREFIRTIQRKVHHQFGIDLKTEPQLIY